MVLQSYASGVLGAGGAGEGPKSNGVAMPSALGDPLAVLGPLGGPLGGPPCAVLLLQFLGLDGMSSSSGRLAVTVLEARCLPARDYGPSPDPGLQLGLARRRSRWPSLLRLGLGSGGGSGAIGGQDCRPLHLLRTRTVRHARQPQYNEDFAVEARKVDLKVTSHRETNTYLTTSNFIGVNLVCALAGLGGAGDGGG